MRAIKKIMQEYWENIPTDERRAILAHVVTKKALPKKHPIFKQDDLPYKCLKAWLEESIAKMDWDLEYSHFSCKCH